MGLAEHPNRAQARSHRTCLSSEGGPQGLFPETSEREAALAAGHMHSRPANEPITKREAEGEPARTGHRAQARSHRAHKKRAAGREEPAAYLGRSGAREV